MKFAKLLVFVPVTLGAITIPINAPKIISSDPKFWETAVNVTSLKTISLTFDQPMRSGFSSWLGRCSVAPDVHNLTATSADGKTMSLAVKFEPGKVYVFALNEVGIPGVGFQTEKGVALRPTYLVFQTAGTPCAEDTPPKVLATFPAAATKDVNPAAAKGITVTFDKPMDSKKHGLHLLENKQAIAMKNLTYTYSTDGKTFTLNYPVKPSASYEVELNNNQDIGFATANRIPLWPYHFAFTTGQLR